MSEECFSDVSLGMQNGAHEVIVVHGLKDHFHIFLEKFGFKEESSLFSVRFCSTILLYSGTLSTMRRIVNSDNADLIHSSVCKYIVSI